MQVAELYNCIKQQSNIYPFHMPGHKRNTSFFPENLLQFDITELPQTDNLHNPTGLIQKLGKKISLAYKADESFILVNGATSGVVAATMSICHEGESILIARNSHISVYNGLILSGGSFEYIYPEVTSKGIYGGVKPEQVEDSILKNPKAKAIFITSPTYEGFCSDVKAIAQIVHKYNKILIVDEAHGSHFGFHESLPKSAITLGADIVIHSFHKTLPLLNQCAAVHTKGIYANMLKRCCSLIQTTSPSYIFLATIDNLFTHILNEGGEIFDEYCKMVNYFGRAVEHTKCLKLIDKTIEGKYGIDKIDIGRLVFLINAQISEKQLEKLLVENHLIQLEAIYKTHAIAITSIADTYIGINKLIKGILSIEKDLIFCDKPITIKKEQLTKSLTLRKAFFSNKVLVPLQKAIGLVSADFIVLYPPGVPLVAPGHVISKYAIDLILNNIEDCVGVCDGKIQVVL